MRHTLLTGEKSSEPLAQADYRKRAKQMQVPCFFSDLPPSVSPGGKTDFKIDMRAEKAYMIIPPNVLLAFTKNMRKPWAAHV